MLYLSAMNHIPETERLYLREFTLDDAQLLFDMHQDPAITKYTGDPVPWDSVDMVRQILTDTIMPQYTKKIGRWGVFLKSTGAFIGWCGLKDIGSEIDLGYRYIRKYWGNGYATEAAKAVLAYGIAQKLPNIVGRASIHNQASVKVLDKIGLVYQGTYTDPETCDVSVRYVCLP